MVTRNRKSLHLDMINGHEENRCSMHFIGQGCKYEHAPCLRHALDQELGRHTPVLWGMASEKTFICGDIFQGNNTLSRQELQYPVDEYEGKPVGQHLQYMGSRITLRFRMIIHLANKIQSMGLQKLFLRQYRFLNDESQALMIQGRGIREGDYKVPLSILKGGSPS